MASFDKAIEFVLKNEGGFVDDPKDTGGATKYGISLAFLKRHGIDVNKDGVVNKGDVVILSVDDAKKLYKENFWLGDGIKEQTLATKFLDCCVLEGVGQATHLLQRALNYLGAHLVEDGVFGEQTLAALNSADKKKVMELWPHILVQFYERCVEVAPQKRKFLDNWLSRSARWA
jgi:lysozyme family protein